MDSLEKLLNEFTDAFYQDNMPLMAKIHQLIQSSPAYIADLPKFPSLEYSQYLSDVDLVARSFAFIKGKDWRVVRESPNIRVESRGGGSEFFTKSTVKVEVNIFQVLAVLSEADLVTTW